MFLRTPRFLVWELNLELETSNNFSLWNPSWSEIFRHSHLNFIKLVLHVYSLLIFVIMVVTYWFINMHVMNVRNWSLKKIFDSSNEWTWLNFSGSDAIKGRSCAQRSEKTTAPTHAPKPSFKKGWSIQIRWFQRFYFTSTLRKRISRCFQ